MKIEALVRDNIRALKAYASARDEFSGTTGIFLDANENPYGTYNRYPDPYQNALKSALSDIKQVAAEHIFIGNGSDEVIDLAFRIFCQPGIDQALIFSPTYGMYDVSAAINDVTLLKVPLNASFQMDTQALLPYFEDARLKLIFICSPNNPTGNLMQTESIEFILQQFKGIVIIDEAYIDFAQTKSWAQRITEYPNLIVSQTFSKAWGLAAARVGVAYMNTDLLHYFNKVKPPYNVSQLNQEAALMALTNESIFEEHLHRILVEKKRLIHAFSEIDVIKKVYPSDANFLLVEVDDAPRWYEQLIAAGVIIRNRHQLVSNCLRITVGTSEENEALLEAFKSDDLT